MTTVPIWRKFCKICFKEWSSLDDFPETPGKPFCCPHCEASVSDTKYLNFILHVEKRPRIKKDTHPFVIVNRGKEITGSVMRDPKKFPLKPDESSKTKPYECSWSRYQTQAEAEEATSALQAYLDDYENPKAVKARAAAEKVKEKKKQQTLF